VPVKRNIGDESSALDEMKFVRISMGFYRFLELDALMIPIQ
jgi:hypothetical protein